MLRARYRHILRFREIGKILTKHGLGQIVTFLNRGDTKGLHLTASARVRTAMEELGPTFVKLGQLLSTRPDLLPPQLIIELERLQDKVNPVPFKQITTVLAEELGEDYSKIFASLEEEPLAAASIGQVYRGKLISGEEVVLKIQRPGIAKLVETDLEILYDSARVIQAKTKWGAFYRVVDMVEEFIHSIKEELDYTTEGRNADRFNDNFGDDLTVKFPKIYWEYSTPRVLTMEYMAGIKINNIESLQVQGFNLTKIAQNAANAIFRQIYLHGFFHADPHPGNLAVMVGERVCFMDFGQVGRLDEDLRTSLVNLVLAIVRQNTGEMTNILIEVGHAHQTVDAPKLNKDLRRMMEKYYDLPMQQLNLGDVISDMLSMAYVYKIRVPAEIVLLGKSLVTLEGLVKQLDANLSIVDLAEPFAKVLIKDKFSPGKVKKYVLNNLQDTISLFLKLPHRLDHLAGQIEKGQLIIQVENQKSHELIQSIQQTGNRLALSIVLAAIIMGTALLTYKSPTLFLGHIPLAEVGLIIGIVIAIWLFLSIRKAGKL